MNARRQYGVALGLNSFNLTSLLLAVIACRSSHISWIENRWLAETALFSTTLYFCSPVKSTANAFNLLGISAAGGGFHSILEYSPTARRAKFTKLHNTHHPPIQRRFPRNCNCSRQTANSGFQLSKQQKAACHLATKTGEFDAITTKGFDIKASGSELVANSTRGGFAEETEPADEFESKSTAGGFEAMSAIAEADCSSSGNLAEKFSTDGECTALYSIECIKLLLEIWKMGVRSRAERSKQKHVPSYRQSSFVRSSRAAIANPNRRVNVYTDGCCRNNGRNGARAGVGVYFPDHPELNVQEPLDAPRTNNGAELTAIKLAVQRSAALYRPVTVYTDSRYAVESINNWMPNIWEKNGWKTYNGDEVKNKEILLDIQQLRKASSFDVNVEWIAGHSKTIDKQHAHGNEVAHKLANKGALNIHNNEK